MEPDPLNIGNTFAYRQLEGIVPERYDREKIIDKGLHRELAHFLNNTCRRPSVPTVKVSFWPNK